MAEAPFPSILVGKSPRPPVVLRVPVRSLGPAVPPPRLTRFFVALLLVLVVFRLEVPNLRSGGPPFALRLPLRVLPPRRASRLTGPTGLRLGPRGRRLRARVRVVVRARPKVRACQKEKGRGRPSCLIRLILIIPIQISPDSTWVDLLAPRVRRAGSWARPSGGLGRKMTIVIILPRCHRLRARHLRRTLRTRSSPIMFPVIGTIEGISSSEVW